MPNFIGLNGRRERIRTSGPYVPNVVLYQAELLSDAMSWGRNRPRAGGPYSHGPPPPQPGEIVGKKPGFAPLILALNPPAIAAMTARYWGVAKR